MTNLQHAIHSQSVDTGGSAEGGANPSNNSEYESSQVAKASTIAGITGNQVNYSISITTMKDMWWFAETVSKTPFVPKDLANNPASCFIAMQFGLELGISPMQAIQNIAVINGRPTLWGDAMLAVVSAHPDCIDIEEKLDTETNTAICIVKRRGRNPVVRSFSEEDAKRAGLWGKNVWKSYPQRMLQMRARSWALRDSFPDALKGMMAREEAQDIESKPTPQMGQPAVNNRPINALEHTQLQQRVVKLENGLQQKFKDWMSEHGYTNLTELTLSAYNALNKKLDLTENGNQS